MAISHAIIGPIAGLLDTLIPDPKARDEAKLKLLELQGSREMEAATSRCPRSSPTRDRPIPGPAARGRLPLRDVRAVAVGDPDGADRRRAARRWRRTSRTA